MALETLNEIAIAKAVKQSGQVDYLTEESPILAVCKWKESSHNMWNMAETIKDIQGPAFVDVNAPLPAVGVSSGLVKVDLGILGGEMEVPQDMAKTLGGPAKYFAGKEPKILKKAGNDTEGVLYYDNWFRFAIDNKQVTDAGGTGNGCNSIMVVRFDEDANCGLYDGNQFSHGTLLQVEALNNGALMRLKNVPYEGVNGYAVQLKGRFGWQILSPKCVHVIVNIDSAHTVTRTMLDVAVAKAHGTSANTYMFCHPMTKAIHINQFKDDHMMMSVQEKTLNANIDAWGESIPIVTSYNLKHGAEAHVSV